MSCEMTSKKYIDAQETVFHLLFRGTISISNHVIQRASNYPKKLYGKKQ